MKPSCLYANFKSYTVLIQGIYMLFVIIFGYFSQLCELEFLTFSIKMELKEEKKKRLPLKFVI